MRKTYRIGILGATGAVGEELITLLQERKFPIAELRLLSSERSAGKQLVFDDQSVTVQSVSAEVLKGLDLVFASAGGAVSRQWLPIAVAEGAIAIDNSSAYRMDPEVPLVVPEVNPEDVVQHCGIIANPNCTTILMCVAIAPLHRAIPIRRIVASTYQSASGAGARAMAEVKVQAQAILDGASPNVEVLPYPLAFNLFLHNSPMDGSGYCEEELKMVRETRKIMGEPSLALTATCVRVPVLRAHSEAINLEFAAPFAPDKAREILRHAPGVMLVEDFDRNYFPMPLEATGKDPVLVGRIRQDLSHTCGLDLWLCGDQIRKGAALNAVQIAELLMARGLL
ncbi:MAG: aspartate-semialdehyde dehydrogenase [Oscillatoriales cyanobacterium SM2_2_1]|nr:aspartate-semialdehyde dehydrogenase [Oscillatoriales cyanobacterium SM2_2_1]